MLLLQYLKGIEGHPDTQKIYTYKLYLFLKLEITIWQSINSRSMTKINWPKTTRIKFVWNIDWHLWRLGCISNHVEKSQTSLGKRLFETHLRYLSLWFIAIVLNCDCSLFMLTSIGVSLRFVFQLCMHSLLYMLLLPECFQHPKMLHHRNSWLICMKKQAITTQYWLFTIQNIEFNTSLLYTTH